ncbi:MAG: spermidine/putrescine ABC transporter substrate-binding protein [Kiritimatiellae bacterium]|nr:spermidine/putrescine ABC transporter substrate-binding protein [Kiritimatiellia bacterium]
MMNMWKVSAVAAAAVAVAGCTQSESVDLSPCALAAAESSGITPESAKGGELHIYTWSDYLAPELIMGFEKALGVRVVVDTFDSNEAMYAKLKAGGTGYDLMTPSAYQIPQMAREGMIDKIDHSKCPNVKKNFDPSFVNQVVDPEFVYSVPYSVTYTGFMYDKSKIPEGVDVESWKILENPAMKGRVTLLDDIREVIGGGLMALGYSINSTNPAEIDAAVTEALKWRHNARKFDAESYKTEVAAGSIWIGHGYSTDAAQVIVGDEEEGMEPRDDIGFALPKEGFTISFDEMVIAKDAKRKDLAYAFINFIYEGEAAKANMEYLCGPNPVKPGIDLLDEETRNIVLLDPEVLKRGQILKSIDDPKVMELYNKAWDRIKATE